jgi:prepilin-type N-terminal cleavage/methylation domain-containing protein
MMTHSIKAFTLIELLISIALGSLLIYVAMAGLTVASQSIIQANRLSLSNGMLRTAVVAANYEMDFWDTFDSRSDLTKQPLRNGPYPFKELAFNTSTTSLQFDHSNAREWYNGHIWSSVSEKGHPFYMNRLGDYSIFGKSGMANDREWRHTILKHITDNLGYYAAVDYLPANYIYAFYDADGKVPEEFGRYGQGLGKGNNPPSGHFNTNHRERDQPKSKPEMGHSAGFSLTSVGGNSNNMHPGVHRFVFTSDQKKSVDFREMRDFSRYPKVDFLPVKPEAWPGVTIKTAVYFYQNRFHHVSHITIVDPLNGEDILIGVDALTTTLRGARRQRGLDLEVSPVAANPRIP